MGAILSAGAVPSAAATGSYDGPLIDAVVQWTRQMQIERRIKIEDIVGHLRRAQVDKAGIMVAVPAMGVDKAVVEQRTDALEELSAGGPKSLFFQGSPNYFQTAAKMAPESVELFIKETERKRYSFVGEILYRHADKLSGDGNPGGETHIDPLSPDSVSLIARVGGLRETIPIFIHWEFYRWDEDRPRFARLFRMFPKQIFIINHMGFGSPAEVKDILKEHDNVFFTISKKLTPFEYFADPAMKQGASILDEQKIVRAEWKELFVAHPTRFLFATDSHKHYMWDHYEEIVRAYRRFLSQLPEDVVHKIAHQNAEAVFGLKK
ncbi:MAG: amidohydrolase family protein [Elusimicrobia bacterium]|nr:amidohydrolase family protein [Elusimicrobiota bacterium]